MNKMNVVLVGGGHAHVQVMMEMSDFIEKNENVVVTLVSDWEKAYYSGMLPGCVAMLYEDSDIQIDLVGLAGMCGIQWVQGSVIGISGEEKVITLEDGRVIQFDYCSVNIGSTVSGYDVPGVNEFAICTRPISMLSAKLVKFEESFASEMIEIVVVGAGVAGIELAFGLYHRYLKLNIQPRITLINSTSEGTMAAELGSQGRSLLIKELRKFNIHVISETRCTRISEDLLFLDNGEELEYNLAIWATGAASHPVTTDIDQDERGFFAVNNFLQSTSHECIFGAGDCVNIIDSPWIKKAGVYAVREGPILSENLKRAIQNKSLKQYKPQTDFLRLIMTGDNNAIAYWKGWAIKAKAMWTLKDKIDTDFMNRFSTPTKN